MEYLIAKVTGPFIRRWVWLRAYVRGHIKDGLMPEDYLEPFEACLLDFTPAQQAWIRAATKAYLAKYRKAYVAGKNTPDEVDFTKLGLPPFPPTPPLYRRVFRFAIATPAANLTGRLAGWFNGHSQHAVNY